MVVPEDGCSTMNADWHNAAINFALQNVSTVTTYDKVIDAIGPAPRVNPIEPAAAASSSSISRTTRLARRGFADSGAADFASRTGRREGAPAGRSPRAAGMQVIHVWHVDEPGHVDSTRTAPLFRQIVEADGLVRRTWGVQPVEGLEPHNGESRSSG